MEVDCFPFCRHNVYFLSVLIQRYEPNTGFGSHRAEKAINSVSVILLLKLLQIEWHNSIRYISAIFKVMIIQLVLSNCLTLPVA
jgi:CRISPR/Cas system-associated exonuclease Cas4 (RecB family)